MIENLNYRPQIALGMTAITCIKDLRALHERRVPRMFYDYAESGSWSESTFRPNVQAFAEIQLR